jgi:glycosyltransferase involved in cell wall biosynthesis
MELLKPANRQKAAPANNTINFQDIPHVPETREQIKAEFGLPFKKFILFAGTMGVGGERKKVEQLIEIFRDIDVEDYGLAIVGSGMPEAVKQRINPKNTRYFGALHDPKDLQISKLFKAADLFVVPGHIGLGLNQAFYWGLPVVTAAGNQPPEIHLLKSGRNGFMVPENDVVELKQKILKLLGDDRLWSEFSTNARNDVHGEASTEGMFQGFWSAVNIAAARKS